MSPNFLAKLVKSSPSSSREGSRRARTPSPAPSDLSRTVTYTALPSIVLSSSSTRSSTPDSVNQPSVTIIPPSPLSSSTEDVVEKKDRTGSDRTAIADPPGRDRRTSFSSGSNPAATPLLPDKAHTPNQTRNNDGKPSLNRPLTPSSSTSNLHEMVQNKAPSKPSTSVLDFPSTIRRQLSNKSLKSIASTVPPLPTSSRSPEDDSKSTAVVQTMSPIVESPTPLTFPNPFGDPIPRTASPLSLTTPSPRSPDDATTVPPNTPASSTISSATTSTSLTNASTIIPEVPKKKRSWRRGSTPSRKPTGLASALAVSAMNGLQKAQQQQRKSAPASPRSASSANLPTPSVHGTERTRSTSSHKPRSRRPSNAPSVSAYGENNSEIYGDDRSYSGLESSSEDGTNSSDDLLDLDLGEDMPVTGFAVASNKRNADFHELFPNIPEGDYLIEDYGCALQREILIQGRMYISENHVCFHSNIFGWVTNLSIPIFEITALEKKMTAFVIPNAIQITTRQAKYTVASFLSRDTTFDIIFNIWRLAKPEDSAGYSAGSGRESLDGRRLGMDEVRVVMDLGKTEEPLRKATRCACSQDGSHYPEIALETVLPGTPDRIHNLMFASGFMKDFMKIDQKLLDIQISDWSPTSPSSKLLARNMSYIRPLTGSIGPKQTKCEIRDETVYADFDDHIVTVTSTRTPDVPSGNVFVVKTRTCIMWASAISTKVIVTTQVEWTGRSFIKGIIERSAIEGQKQYHTDLDLAMRAYIRQHQSEFVPQGVDPAAVAPIVADIHATEPVTSTEGHSEAEEWKKREHERNQRGLQWALDTFEGASQVAKRSTWGAIELIKEAWEQSTSTTICIFIIIGLVFSNLWTMMMMGNREEIGRRREMLKTEAKEKWVQSVVTALWDEMAAGKGPNGVIGSTVQVGAGPVYADWREEVGAIRKTLDGVEERVRTIRESLDALD